MSNKPIQTFAGVVRQRLDDFEESHRIGISHQILVDQLKKDGYEVNIDTFRNALYRARKAAKKAAKAEKESAAKAVAPTRRDVAKQPSPVMALNKHSGFTMPPPLDPKDIY